MAGTAIPLSKCTAARGMVPARAVRRRHCVGGGAPVNFGRRAQKVDVGGGGAASAVKNFFFKDSQNNFVLSSEFSDNIFSHQKLQQNKYTATMTSTARRQIIGGGVPINKSRRRQSPQIVGGAA